MIYEYPKEFMVPVVYVENLIQKGNELIREWNLFGMEESIPYDEINYRNIKYNGKNQIDDDIYQELLKSQYEDIIYSYNMGQEMSDNDDIKNIFNNIDEEYAISETLSI